MLFASGEAAHGQSAIVNLLELSACDVPYGMAPAFVDLTDNGGFVFVDAIDGRIVECTSSGGYRDLGAASGDVLAIRYVRGSLEILARVHDRIVVLDPSGNIIAPGAADILPRLRSDATHMRATYFDEGWLLGFRDSDGTVSVSILSDSASRLVVASLELPGSAAPIVISDRGSILVVSEEYPFRLRALDHNGANRFDIELAPILLATIAGEGLARPWRLVSILPFRAGYILSFRDTSSIRRFSVALNESWEAVELIRSHDALSLLSILKGEIVGISIHPHLRLHRLRVVPEADTEQAVMHPLR